MCSCFNSRSFSNRVEHQASVPMEPTLPHSDTSVVRAASHRERENDDEEEDEYGENEPVPDLEKDDMMARRTGLFQKPSAARSKQSISQFLPVPGSVKYSVAPVSAMKPFNSRPKLTERMATGRYFPVYGVGQLLQLTTFRQNLCRSYGPSTNTYMCPKG